MRKSYSNEEPRALSPQRFGRARIDLAARWAAGWRCEKGISAVEFALIAPILFFALLATADLGFAAYERLAIHHSLRAGAQSAMADPGSPYVLDVMKSTASKNFTLSDQEAASADSLKISASRFCACPDNTGVTVTCSTTCSGSEPTYIYYSLSASKIYQGMIMPAITQSPSIQIQVR